MLRHRILLKLVAVFFVLEILGTTVWPTAAYALTSGPTAPESSSFEPIDTTDLVNPNTGDLTYNIPLIDVPGPAGGYPLSLSYHAGIMTGEDASWVGLGWTLNPGAINRSVNGFADDFSNVTETDRVFWQGGSSTTWTVGITIGYGGGAGVSAGLVFSDDTYKGFGVGHYAGITASYSLGKIGSVGLSHESGVSPYGGSYSSTGMSVGIGKSVRLLGGLGSLGGSADAQLSFDKNGNATGSAGADIGVKGGGALMNGSAGYSISTSGRGFYSSVSAAGGLAKRVHNGKAGKISTSGYNRQVTIPTPWNFSIRIGKSYTRYWIDEKESVGTYGALNFPENTVSWSSLDDKAYDVYDLQLNHYSEGGLYMPGEEVDEEHVTPTPDMDKGGAFVDYDNYMVSGQGVMGTIRPYHFQANLLRQTNTDKDDETVVSSYPLAGSKKATFRFVGDFSNQYVHDQTLDAFTYFGSPTAFTSVSFAPHDNRLTGENGNDGYDALNNRLAGSRHIEWFTNAQIAAASLTDTLGLPVPYGADAAINQGFIDCKAVGFTRVEDSKIGGFKIINESGVTYHYALPVYSYDEHSYSGNQDYKDKHRFNSYKKTEPYAYTWLLTAVTGPDFVDRNQNGYADRGDWGYWVTFEYGKWSHAFSWRNPATGFNKDIDYTFNNFSKGKKELYYLNTITTETHTAVFVKELRLDGKGVVHEISGAVKTGFFHTVTAIDHGGFDSKEKSFGELEYMEHPVSTLKLKSVYLFENKDLASYSNVAADLSTRGSVYFHNQGMYATDFGKYTYGDYVIDVHDIAAAPEVARFQNNAIKRIDLNTDYSLAPGTENSFRSLVDVINTGQASSATKQGKLTLRSIKVYGRGGVGNLIPETKFNYDVDYKFSANYYKYESSNSLKLTVHNFSEQTFQRGELLTFTYSSNPYYAYINEIDELNGTLTVKLISGSLSALPVNASSFTFAKTKNPPYGQNHYDLWGCYKSDYEELGNENITRMTTSLSAQSVDVWSLREIETSTGAKIKIEYEADRYKAALKKLSNVQIKNVENYGSSRIKLILFENASEFGLAPGDIVDYQFMTRAKLENYYSFQHFLCNDIDFDYAYVWGTHAEEDAVIRSIIGNEVIIDGYYAEPVLDPLETCAWKEDTDGKNYHTTHCDPENNDEINVEVTDGSFIGGELLFDNRVFSPYGGDVRVKAVTVQTDNSNERSTSYEYVNGITTYEPVGFAVPISTIPGTDVNDCIRRIETEEIGAYRKDRMGDIYEQFLELFMNARELPSPMVMYEKVLISETVKKDNMVTRIPAKTEYVFEVFYPGSENTGLITAFQNQITTGQRVSGSATNSSLGDYDITGQSRFIASARDYSAMLGALKRITLYDDQGNKVTETINHYLHDDFDSFAGKLESLNHQGVITETFADARIIRDEDEEDEYSFLGLTSQKVRYPSVQTGQTQINYKTGIKTTSENLAFDFYSGSATKVLSRDGYGNAFVTEATPAYRVYPVMGPAYMGGYNMLTQEARSSTYKIDPSMPGADTKLGLASSSVQSWSAVIPVLDHPELTENFVFYMINKRNSSTGLYPANSNGFTNYLKCGDRVRFANAGYSYMAKVVSSERNTTHNRYDYDLQMIENPSEIGGANFNVAAQRITVPRKHSTYEYIGDDNTALQADGLHQMTDDDVPQFNAWNNDFIPVNWQKTSETTLYDVQSNALEARDMNGRYAATKMSVDHTKVLATIANAAYREFAYSGAEEDPVLDLEGRYYFGGDVYVADDYPQFSSSAHTGSRSIKASPLEDGNAYGFIYSAVPTAGKTYHVSFWSNDSNAKIRYGTTGVLGSVEVQKTVRSAGGWYLIEGNITVEGSPAAIFISCSGTPGTTLFDDFRVRPGDATMVSYVYNQWNELSHILDNNNLYTEYRYDAMGRLRETFKETLSRGEGNSYGSQGIVKMNEVIYNYGANTPYTTTLTTSTGGPSGTLSQTGVLTVSQGGQLTVEIRETCATPRLQSVSVDNVQIYSIPPSQTLPDGTVVSLNGALVTFKNIQSPHTLHVQFMQSPVGFVRCYSSVVNGINCYDGWYEYGYYNACGQEISVNRAQNSLSVPQDLQQFIPAQPCCPTAASNPPNPCLCQGPHQQY